jgi:hypothetical protein
MAIRISRNEAGNCLNFIGSTQPAYWNACLSAQLNADDSSRVDIINDIRSANEAEVKFEFYAVDYTDYADRDGNVFQSAQEMVDYIDANANVSGVSEVGTDLSGEIVDFRLDQTSTSIIMDNGASFGVNTIKAVANADGTIYIHAIGAGVPDGSENPDEHVHYEKLTHTNVKINEAFVSGGLQDVVNALNELFTVGAFEAVVITDPEATTIADVGGTVTTYTLEGNTAVDPIGDAIFTNSSSGNYAGLKSVDTINDAGEYFTFDIAGEGQIGFGLIHSDASFAAGNYVGTAIYADPNDFAVLNSAHYGFQFSHWFHPTPNGPWTNYGASTGYVQGPGWASSTLRFNVSEEGADWLAGDNVKMKVGIDANGFIEIAYYDVSTALWVMCARTSYPAPEGSEFHLGIKCQNASSRVTSAPKVHLLASSAPTMYFRYIESPDGEFDYPLFATAEEAEYYDQNHDGTTGSGTYTLVTYPDDPTFTQWYKPDTGFTDAASSAPTNAITFESNPVNWTEVTSQTNADLAPPAFSAADLTVNELASVNYQTQPADTAYTTTVSGLPLGLIANAGSIFGTAPEVTGDNVANPSDSYTITVTRTNSYGSSTGTFDIIVTNLTAPATAISGFTHEAASTTLVDSDTMDDGSVVSMDSTVADGKRFVIPQAYVEANVLPALQAAGDKYYMGIAVNGYNFSTLEAADFEAALVWEYTSASSHTIRFLEDGAAQTSFTVNSMTDAFYDYAIEINGTSAWLIGCNVNSINTEPSPASGGSFTNTHEVTSLGTAAPHTIHMAAESTQADFATTNLSQIDTPAAASSLTNWSKALDFSGNSERTLQVDSSYNRVPMKMSGINNNVAAPSSAGQTSSDSNSRPWATAVVFKVDTYNSNQHIWNVGEGSGTTDDNIYLRRDSSRNLWFGWGRSGEINECLVADIGGSMSGWHAVYIASTGERVGGGHTAADIADCFDIRYTNGGSSWVIGSNLSTSANWTSGSFGYRMNREFTGDMTIGGRGANRSFRGKIAAYVSTTLRRGVAMPSDAEIAEMITDPLTWLNDYKVGNAFRLPWQGTDAGFNFSLNDGSSAYSTQVWLMGDGTNDSYSNMIRNQVNPSDQNYTKLNMISMVSNDIENVTIGGLS